MLYEPYELKRMQQYIRLCIHVPWVLEWNGLEWNGVELLFRAPCSVFRAPCSVFHKPPVHAYVVLNA